jgi:6-phosphogluconolactonase/glucosamine-6-phosphate isomerase/deaminase
MLRRSKHLFLMITGEQKQAVFENSQTLDLPIAAFKEALTDTYFTKAS